MSSVSLRLFSVITPVILTEAVCQRARTFAQAVTPTVGQPGHGYRDSSQNNLGKIHQDHYVSKIGEEAVKTVLRSCGATVLGPDYTVYAGHQKSWEADLEVNGIPLGVKTQTQEAAERFGLSWTFQWGQQRRDPVLLDPDAWVCFVLFAETLSHCWVYPACQIQELTLAEPRLARLKGEKKVVYAQDLPPHLRLRLPKQPSLLAE